MVESMAAKDAKDAKESKSHLRSRIMAGLALVVPVWITWVLVSFVFRIMRDASLWIVVAWLRFYGQPAIAYWGVTPELVAREGVSVLPLYVQVILSLFAVILTVVLLYALGTVTTHVIGKRMVGLGEMIVSRLPLVPVVYHATKKVVETFAQEGGQAFQKVVLVPYPHREMLTVGFVTGETTCSKTQRRFYSVFVPTVPNPTTGFMFLIPIDEVHVLDWTNEEALGIIMSGGVLVPNQIKDLLAQFAPRLSNPTSQPRT